jgi:hypothetical protein
MSEHCATQHHEGRHTAKPDNWAVHKTFFNRRPTLVNLVQKDPRTSLQIFDHTNEHAMIPEKVMRDSGARVFILISPAFAKTMHLTVAPIPLLFKGSAVTRAVQGAQRNSYSYALEDVRQVK